MNQPKFTKVEANLLFRNKMIVMIGDSVMRSAYKDLVLLLVKGRECSQIEMRKKGEPTFYGDRLIEGGTMGLMHNGKDYREVRQMQTPTHLIRFYFTTRAYNAYLETVLADLACDPRPDVVLMSSCVWDMTRYGPRGVHMYKANINRLCMALRQVLPAHCLFSWLSTLPVGEHVTGGVIQKNVQFLGDTLRIDVLLANYWAMQLMNEYGFDMIDLHSVFRYRVDSRLADGIHWDVKAHRSITFYIMEHIRRAWKLPRPFSTHIRSLSQSNYNHSEAF